MSPLRSLGMYVCVCVCVCVCFRGLGDGIAMQIKDDIFCQVGWWLGGPCPIDRKKF